MDPSDGSVVFTHLFSAPLIELRRTASSGEVAEKVDELSYQGECDTLLRTLANAGKKVRFKSEAADPKSFRRAIGCWDYCRTADGRRGGGSGNVGHSSGGEIMYHSVGMRRCRDGKRRILHFTGHGVEGQLTLEDQFGQLQYVDGEDLLAWLQCRSSPFFPSEGGSGGGRRLGAVAPAAGEGRGSNEPVVPQNGLQLVFLSSCHSESVAASFIEAGVPHVIAVKRDSKILDYKAADFAESFYAALLRGDTVRQAFALGSARTGASDNPEEGHRFLLLPLDGNHDVPVFEEVPAGQFRNETPPEPTYRLDAVTENFLGRAVDVQKVVQYMVEGARCVTITGQKGIGKTQVLLKACAYTRERHVFRDFYFCRVDKEKRSKDACYWLEKGFQLPIGSLSAHNMDGAVAAITDHVERELRVKERESVGRRGGTGVRASRQVLLVLDGCTKHVLVGQERVELKDLLKRLFRQLPNLKAAVTMRASSPTDVGGVGISGEEVVVVKGLDDRSTAKLFTMCCSRRLQIREMDPNNEAEVMADGKLDTLGAFAKGEIVHALRGHPACVEDLCRRVHDDNSLLVRKQTLLDRDIPEIQRQYAYDRPWPLGATHSLPPSIVRPIHDSPSQALTSFWAQASGAPINVRFYEPRPGAHSEAIKWGWLCTTMKRLFALRVPGAENRPLEAADFAMFAEVPELWEGPCPARMAESGDGDVSAVRITREKFRSFWQWFWPAITTLIATRAWEAGEANGVRCFAGFMTSNSAEQLLASARPGTFLIRFSTTKPGALVVQYTSSRGRGVVKVAVSVRSRGELLCREGTPRTYKNLSDLALSTSQLCDLYPDRPKWDAFGNSSTRRNTVDGGVRH